MRSFLSYLGGKSRLVNAILPLIPEHKCYCEPFSGAAWVLFGKEESDVEVINDLNSELIALYRVIQRHPDEFIRYLRWVLVSRELFERFKSQDIKNLTDIERAVRFFFLLRTGFGARIKNPTFSSAITNKPRLNLFRIEDELSAAHLRLSRVYIENLPYQDMILKADKVDTFFYLDPPYVNCENYYGDGIFCKGDFEVLRNLMRDMKGKACLSINDVPEIRELFSDDSVFHIRKAATFYSVGANRNKVEELLILNYPPPKTLK